MKTQSMASVLILLSCACLACGARPAGDVPSTIAPPTSDSGTKPTQERYDHDTSFSARPARSYSDPAVSSAVPVADGVQLKRWSEARRAERERRQPDSAARVRAEKANYARASTLPSHELEALEALEAALVAELNRLRSDPAGYAALLSELRTMYRDQVVVVPGYMSVGTQEGVAAVDDAIAAAESTAPMARLARSEGLTRAARAYAYQLGHERTLGRGDDDSITLHRRMDAYGRVNGMFAENVGAVYRDAQLMLLTLFVDDGIETRVHRFNMLGPMFRHVGVGCASHPTYEVVCVMDFAETYLEMARQAK